MKERHEMSPVEQDDFDSSVKFFKILFAVIIIVFLGVVALVRGGQ